MLAHATRTTPIFCPRLTGYRSGILKVLSLGESHPHGDKILRKDGSENDKPTLEMVIGGNINPAQIENIVNYSLPHMGLHSFQVSVLTENRMTFPLDMSIEVISKHNGNYFDAFAYTGETNVYYSKKEADFAHHSGDKFFNLSGDKYLYHKISVKAKTGRFAAGVCGYQKTPLKRFVDNNPFFMVANHETKIIYIIPCPIDEASVGNATLSFFVSFDVNVEERTVTLVVNSPQNVENVDTGCTRRQVFRAAANAFSCFDEQDQEQVITVTEEAKEESKGEESDLKKIKSNILVLHDSENVPPGLSGQLIPFKAGFGDKSGQVKMNPYGESRGHPILELGKNSLWEIGENTIGESHIIHVIDPKEGWFYPAVKSCPWQGNGIFIILVPENKFNNLADLELMMTPMFGPRSYVVCFCNGVYRYYSGRATGFPKVDFGEDIPFTECVNTWVETPLEFSTVSLNSDTRAFVSGREVTPETFEEHIESMSKGEILYALNQFKIVCEPNVFSPLIVITANSFYKESSEEGRGFEDRIREFNDTGEYELMMEEAKKLKQFKNEQKEINKDFLKELNQLVSEKGVISKNQSVDRAKRKAVISQNVYDALNSSIEEIIEKCFSDDAGVVFMNVDPHKLQDILRSIQEQHRSSEQAGESISTEKFVATHSVSDKLTCLKVDNRCTVLDGDTVGILYQVTNEREHPCKGEKTVVLPSNQGGSIMGICLFDEYMTDKIPNLRALSQDSKIAMHRIKLREAVSKALCCRGISIPNDSILLGASLSIVVLSCLEEFTASMKDPPEDGSTSQQIVRGLLGFVLTTMASGVNGQFPSWKIFSSEKGPLSPETFESFKITKRVVKQALLAGWMDDLAKKRFVQAAKNTVYQLGK